MLSELINSLATGFALFVVTALLRWVLLRILPENNLILLAVKVLPLTIVATVVCQSIYALIIVPNQQLIFGQVADNIIMALIQSMPNLWPFVVVWTAVFILITNQSLIQQNEKQQLELKMSLQVAKLDLLMNQLNPHFIFNALNNIRALIIEDSSKSRVMLAHLSDVMRYTMQQDDKLISFDDEISITKQYLALNKLHFEKRLNVNWQIGEGTHQLIIPKMLIQLLVENAIKHGIAKLKLGGEISISANMCDDSWKIRVVNTGQLNQNTDSATGVGLANIKQRIALIYQGAASFSLKQQSDNVVAELILPVQNPRIEAESLI
jgi:two-component system, LytTR family, sensor kinase